MRTTCRACGEALPPVEGKGRPRVFCSAGCKRAREYAVKRTAGLLETFEERLSWNRINGHTTAQLARFEDEVRRLEERLRELLDDAEEVRHEQDHR